MTKRATKKKKTHVVETVVAAVAESGGAASTEHAERVEEETVQQVRQRLRAERASAEAAAKIARDNLRMALRQLPIDQLIERAVYVITDSERMRKEAAEWQNVREAGEGPKLWRSRDAYVEALATELDSQRARCEELQVDLKRYGEERHGWNNELSSRIGETIALKNAELTLEKRRYADLLSVEKNRRERLELNLVTLLESLQVVGVVGVAGVGAPSAAPNRKGDLDEAFFHTRHNSHAQVE